MSTFLGVSWGVDDCSLWSPVGPCPIHRTMREVQLAAGGRQVAPTFPLIVAHWPLANRFAAPKRFGSGSAQCSRTFFSRFSHEPDLGPIADIRSIEKCGRCNLPPAGGKLHRHFHSSVPDSQYPMHRKMWEVQLAAGGRQVAPTFPLSDAHWPLPNRFAAPKRFGSGSGDSPVRYVNEASIDK